jgi:hypothetical protein
MILVDAPVVMGERRGVRGYLYLTDPEGNEMAIVSFANTGGAVI